MSESGASIVGVYNESYNVRNIVNSGLIGLKKTILKNTKNAVIFIHSRLKGNYLARSILKKYMGDTHVIDIMLEDDNKTINPLELNTLMNYSGNHSINGFAILGICLTSDVIHLYRADAHELLKLIMNVDQLQLYSFHSKFNADAAAEKIYYAHINLLASSGILINDIYAESMGKRDPNDFGGHDKRDNSTIEKLKVLTHRYRGNSGIISPGYKLSHIPLNISGELVNRVTMCVDYDKYAEQNANDLGVSIGGYINIEDSGRRYTGSNVINIDSSPSNDHDDVQININAIAPCDVSKFMFTKSFKELQRTRAMTIPVTRTIGDRLLKDLEVTSEIIKDNSFYYLVQYLNETTTINLEKNMVFKAYINVGIGNLIYLLGRFNNAMGCICYLLLQVEIAPVTKRAILKFFQVTIEDKSSGIISQSLEIELEKTACICIYHSQTYKTYNASLSMITESAIHLAGNNVCCRVSYDALDNYEHYFITGCPVYSKDAMHRVTYTYRPVLWQLAVELPRKMITQADGLLIGLYDELMVGTPIDTQYFATAYRTISINSAKITSTHKKMCKLLGSHYYFKSMINTVYDFDIVGLDECGSRLFELLTRNGVFSLTSYCNDADTTRNVISLTGGYKWLRIVRLPGKLQFFVSSADNQVVINHITGNKVQLANCVEQINLFQRGGRNKLQRENRIEIIDNVVAPNDILYPPTSLVESEENEEFIGNVSLPAHCDVIENISLYLKINQNVMASDGILLYGGYIMVDISQPQSYGILTSGNKKYILQARYEYDDSTVYYVAPSDLYGDTSSRCNFTSTSSKLVLG